MNIRFKADGTRVDDEEEGVLRDGEWVLASPMLKDSSAVPAQDAVPVNDAHAEYVDRLTRRTTTQDAQDATMTDAHAAYVDRLTRRTAPVQDTTVDAHDDAIDAHAAYVDRLKRT